MNKICSLEKCDKVARGRGFCSKHYMKLYRHGDPNWKIQKIGRTPTSITWTSMKQRCNNPKDPSYPWYGGRGITYDKKWETLSGFIEDMGERPEGHTLDRIDNNGNYCKNNCRWATIKQQANNTSTNRILEYGGLRMNVSEWSEKIGIPRHRLYYRINRGWSDELALTKPWKPRKNR